MQMWRRAAFLAVLAWTISVGMWANRSWTETVALQTPPGVEAQAPTFVCSAPLAAKAVDRQDAGSEGEYPLSREPCDVHGERRALAMFDLGLGVALLVLLFYLGVRYSARKEPVAAAATEP